jgi:hypothetical protein
MTAIAFCLVQFSSMSCCTNSSLPTILSALPVDLTSSRTSYRYSRVCILYVISCAGGKEASEDTLWHAQAYVLCSGWMQSLEQCHTLCIAGLMTLRTGLAQLGLERTLLLQ